MFEKRIKRTNGTSHMTTNYTVLVLEQTVNEFCTWKNSLMELQLELTCRDL